MSEKTITQNLGLHRVHNQKRLHAIRKEMRKLEWRSRWLRIRRIFKRPTAFYVLEDKK
jgi:hypothetical protein